MLDCLLNSEVLRITTGVLTLGSLLLLLHKIRISLHLRHGGVHVLLGDLGNVLLTHFTTFFLLRYVALGAAY